MTSPSTPQDQVREFHEVFGLFIGDKPSAAIPNELARLRSRLLDEEVEEVFEAVLDGDVAQIAKELADVVYIAYGTALTYGIDLDKVISAVHVSNLSKRAADGTVLRREDGKVEKSEHYVPPNIKEVLGL